MLWEQSGQPVTLTSPAIAPGWQTRELKGEALWPQPEGLAPASLVEEEEAPVEVAPIVAPDVPGEGESFS